MIKTPAQERDYRLLLLRLLDYFNNYPVNSVRSRTYDLAAVTGLGVWRVYTARKYAEYILLSPLPDVLTREEVVKRLRDMGTASTPSAPSPEGAKEDEETEE